MRSYSWLQAAEDRIKAGDDEIAVMADYGWVQITPAEREAIETCILGLTHPDDSTEAATLRGLLERLA